MRILDRLLHVCIQVTKLVDAKISLFMGLPLLSFLDILHVTGVLATQGVQVVVIDDVV